MIRVWLLLCFCVLLAHYYEKCIISDNNGIEDIRIESNASSALFFILLITLVLFSGLRTVMNDTSTYIQSYSNDLKVQAGWNTIFHVDWRVGSNPLFSVYERIIKTIFGSNPQVFIFISAVIVVCSYLKFIRKFTAHFGLSIFTLIAFCVYAFSLAAMKQTLSIAIGIWSIPCLINKKYFKALALLFIAFLFHPYVLILGALVFFKNDVWKRNTLIIIAVTILISFAFDSFVNLVLNFSETLGENYKVEYFSEGGVRIARIISYLIIPTITFFAREEINALKNPMVNICVNASILSGALMFISGFGGSFMFGRVPSYYDVFTCITVSVVFSTCIDFKGKKIFKAFFVCLMLVYYFTYYSKYLGVYSNGWFADFYQHTSIGALFGR